MSVGLITSPSSWALGTVLAPSWAQNVQDNSNLFYNTLVGGSLSATSLALDGVGNQSVSPAAAQLLIGQSALADTPLALFKDQSGNFRYLIDHNGFPRGRYGLFQDHWVAPFSLSASSSGTVTNDPQWQYSTSANAAISAGASWPLGSTTDYMSSFVSVTPGTVSTNKAVLYSLFVGNITTKLIFVIEFDFALTAVGANNEDWLIGLSATPTAVPSTSPQVATAAFRRLSTDTNWQALTADGVANNVIDTGVAATANATLPADVFRIEYHGSATPYGIAAVEGGSANSAKVRFFINGVRRATSSTNVPPTNNNLQIVCNGTCTGAASAVGRLGPVLATWNRTLAGYSL